MNIDHKAKIRGQIAADLLPGIAGVVAAHYVPMLLHEQHIGLRPMQRNPVHAVSDFGVRIGNVLRM